MIIKKYREGSCSSFFYINTEALGNLGSSRLTRLADTPHDLSSWIYSLGRNCPLNSTRLIEIPVERIVQFSTLLHDDRCLASFYADAARRWRGGERRYTTIHEERGEKEEPRKWRIPVIKSLVGRRTAGQPSVNWLLNLIGQSLTLAVSSWNFPCV